MALLHTKLKKKTKKSNKPKPEDLGSGAAANAGRKLRDRRAQIDAILSGATGGKSRKGMKKTKGRK